MRTEARAIASEYAATNVQMPSTAWLLSAPYSSCAHGEALRRALARGLCLAVTLSAQLSLPTLAQQQ